MASKYPEEDISSMCECAICLQDMLNRTPKALPCLHTFCMECIQGLPSNDNKITCPTCREECDLGTKRVEHLPDNFHLHSLMHTMRQSTKNCISCSMIGKLSKVTTRCVECELEMCSACTTIHEMKFQGKHEILVFSTSKYDVITCDEHKSRNVKHYCEDCHEMACPLCVICGSHSTHHTKEIKDLIGNIKNDKARFLKVIENKAHHLTSYNETIHENLQKTLAVKENIQATAKLMIKSIEEQTCILLQKCTEECEEPLRKTAKINEESMSILDYIKENCTPKQESNDSMILTIAKTAELNKNITGKQILNIKTPNFLGNRNVILGDYNDNTSTLLQEISPLNIGMLDKFAKNLEITIENDVPLHICALDNGGVIYSGNKSCKQIDQFGNTVMPYQGITNLIYCLSTKDGELFAFSNLLTVKIWNIVSGAQTRSLHNAEWCSNDVVIISSDTYLNIRKGQNAIFKNGKNQNKFVSGLLDPVCITSYQNLYSGHTILVAADGGKKVRHYDQKGNNINNFNYINGSIQRMCCKDPSCLLVLNRNNQIQQIDTMDGRIVVENVLNPEMKEKITTFSYCHPYLWVAINNKLLQYL